MNEQIQINIKTAILIQKNRTHTDTQHKQCCKCSQKMCVELCEREVTVRFVSLDFLSASSSRASNQNVRAGRGNAMF